jgi:signal transduction histidine kinase
MATAQAAQRERAPYAAARPTNERERLIALQSYAILDTPAERSFDDITELASEICEVPISVVNLIDAERQWFKSEVGLGVNELPLDASICAHAILRPGLTEIPDTLEDERFTCNPLVIGDPGLRFYAGALLETQDGLPIGTLCVLDFKPKKLSESQKRALQTLARQVMTQLELRKALIGMSRAMGYRAQLMAIAGHDLRQPLQVATMSLAALEISTTDASQLKVIGRANRALKTLGDDLQHLALSSRLGDDDVITMDDVDVKALVAAAVENWSLHAQQKKIELKVARCAAIVRSNGPMLATVLGNLIGNAIKYTDQGKVVIGCRRLRDGDVIITVCDSGRGIPKGKLEEIFRPFSQLERTSEGLGLGLSIVRQSVQLLGHKLSVRSRVGRGSCFSVLIAA